MLPLPSIIKTFPYLSELKKLSLLSTVLTASDDYADRMVMQSQMVRPIVALALGHQRSRKPAPRCPPSSAYRLRVTGGPLIRAALSLTVTSTRSAILMKGMPLFIPYCFRSKAIVPLMVPEQVPAPSTLRVSFSAL